MLQEDGKFSVMITWTKRLFITCTILGVGILVAGTAYELYEACEIMRMNSMQAWVWRMKCLGMW